MYIHAGSQPLYNGAPLTTEESVYATYQYAIRNKLSYQATSQLLDLIGVHLPSPNSYPSSFYALKKYVSRMTTLALNKFCSTCLAEVPKEHKHCCKSECKHSSLCYYTVLPFQEHLESIFAGIVIMLVLSPGHSHFEKLGVAWRCGYNIMYVSYHYYSLVKVMSVYT